MFKLLFPALLLAAFVPGQAQARSESAPIRISYADLDLRKPADVQRFDRRLRHAIERACQSDGVRELSELKAVGKCRAKLIGQVSPMRTAALMKAQIRQVAEAR